MFRNILLVIENDDVYEESLLYTRELALRIDARVTVLMIVPMSFQGRTTIGPKRSALKQIEVKAGKVLSQCSERFIKRGIEVGSALKIGDPGTEFMKFLANRPAFQAIVWGSGYDLPDKVKGNQYHWLSRLVVNLECPLLTVSKREER